MTKKRDNGFLTFMVTDECGPMIVPTIEQSNINTGSKVSIVTYSKKVNAKVGEHSIFDEEWRIMQEWEKSGFKGFD